MGFAMLACVVRRATVTRIDTLQLTNLDACWAISLEAPAMR